MHSGPLVLLRIWLLHAKPWQQALAGAVVLSGGVVLVVLGQLVGLLLVVVGVFFALPVISGPSYRTWATVRRALPWPGTDRGR